MEEKLIVRNFGPIKEAEINIKKVTVLIGPQGSGKSILSKLLAIFKTKDLIRQLGAPFFTQEEVAIVPEDFIRFNTERFIQYSENYLLNNIGGYFKNDNPYIEYIGKIYSIVFSHNGSGSPLVFKTNDASLIRDFYKPSLEKKITESKSFITSSSRVNMQQQSWDELFKEKLAHELTDCNSIYIPAERLFFSAVSESIFSLVNANVNLPKMLTSFGTLFETARKEISFDEAYKVPFLDVEYKHENGRDLIKDINGDTFSLASAASGYQSTVPLSLIVNYLANKSLKENTKYHFIIEEPELNLYPTTQKKFLEYLVEKCNRGNLLIATHSPYILTSLNNLLFAYQTAQRGKEERKEANAIIPEKYWLNPADFSAYYVSGETAKSIFNPKTGLIAENELDDVSEEIAGQFDALMDIYKHVKH